MKKQLSFVKGSTQMSKSEKDMDHGLKYLSTFFSDYLSRKSHLEKLGKVNIEVDYEIDDNSLV